MMKRAHCIVGASSGVGRRLVELLAQESSRAHLILVARDQHELESIASDVSIRYGNSVNYLVCDIGCPDFDVESFTCRLRALAPSIDSLFLVAGSPLDRDDGRLDGAEVDYLVRVNFLSHTQIANQWLKQGGALSRVAFLSSIAAHAPRSKNMVYAASKAGGEAYFAALRHARQDITVQVFVMGYVDTALSFGLRVLLPRVSAYEAARRIIKVQNGGTHYVPGFWRFVTWALSMVPWFLFRRLQF